MLRERFIKGNGAGGIARDEERDDRREGRMCQERMGDRRATPVRGRSALCDGESAVTPEKISRAWRRRMERGFPRVVRISAERRGHQVAEVGDGFRGIALRRDGVPIPQGWVDLAALIRRAILALIQSSLMD